VRKYLQHDLQVNKCAVIVEKNSRFSWVKEVRETWIEDTEYNPYSAFTIILKFTRQYLTKQQNDTALVQGGLVLSN
jgi:hypothetical protein